MNGEEINTLPEGAPEEEKKPLIARWREDGLLSRRMIALLIVFAFSLAVYLTARLCTPFAEFWTRYPAQAVRFITAKAMGWFPFSFAECVIISLPVLLIAYITAAIVSGRRDSSNRRFYRLLKPLISLLLVIGILFFAGFGTGYNRNPLEKNLGIERSAVSAFELYETAQKVINEMDNVLPNVSFDSTGASVMPYGFSELTEKVNSAFDGYAAGVDYISHFSSKPKAIALSEDVYPHFGCVHLYDGRSEYKYQLPGFHTPVHHGARNGAPTRYLPRGGGKFCRLSRVCFKRRQLCALQRIYEYAELPPQRTLYGCARNGGRKPLPRAEFHYTEEMHRRAFGLFEILR